MHWFVVPALDGPPSGGTLFNRELLTALVRSGVACTALGLAEAPRRLSQVSPADHVWLDSLYLAELPRLARERGRSRGIGLLLHYLPSLVTKGASLEPADLSDIERAALANAACYLVTSPFMRDELRRLGRAGGPLLYVEPGRPQPGPVQVPPPPPVRALMVANLLPGKGIAEFLGDLANEVADREDFQLEIVGASSDPEYAERCRRRAADPRLRGRARLLGSLSRDEVYARLAASNVFVSASTMESYGMALAEARSFGVPILARPGGHIASLVGEHSGGELVPDAAALAKAFVRLCRNPVDHGRRIDAARAGCLPPRSWSRAAAELIVQLSPLDGPGRRRRGERPREGRTR